MPFAIAYARVTADSDAANGRVILGPTLGPSFDVGTAVPKKLASHGPLLLKGADAADNKPSFKERPKSMTGHAGLLAFSACAYPSLTLVYATSISGIWSAMTCLV